MLFPSERICSGAMSSGCEFMMEVNVFSCHEQTHVSLQRLDGTQSGQKDWNTLSIAAPQRLRNPLSKYAKHTHIHSLSHTHTHTHTHTRTLTLTLTLTLTHTLTLAHTHTHTPPHPHTHTHHTHNTHPHTHTPHTNTYCLK